MLEGFGTRLYQSLRWASAPPQYRKKFLADSFRYPQNVTVSRQGQHWFVALQVELDVPAPVHPAMAEVGIDLGIATSLTICLTMEERQALTAWQRSTSIPAGRARRGRIIILLADGVPVGEIGALVEISWRFV